MNSIPQTGSPFVLVSSPGMHEMAEAILVNLEAEDISFPHYKLAFKHFSNGEVLPLVPETIRRQHVFFLHPLQHPDPNTALMMMLLACDAMMRASADGVTLVIPFQSYQRQDRKDKPRRPISARAVANLIKATGVVQRIITMEMHADQLQGFYNIPVDNLSYGRYFAEHIKARFKNDLGDFVVISPDLGGAVRTRRFAKSLGGLPIAIGEKERTDENPGSPEVLSLTGSSIKGKRGIIIDDIIDTGGTMRGIVAELKQQGLRDAVICATHGILSGPAVKSFSEAGIPIICTDSIPRSPEFAAANPWLTILPLANLLSRAIFEASLRGGSLSKLS